DSVINDSAESSCAEGVETTQVCLEERVDDSPGASTRVLDYPRAKEQLEHTVTDRRSKALGDGLATGQGAGDLEGVLVQPSDALDGLLHRRQVAFERGVVAKLNEVEINIAAAQQHRDE